MFEFQFDTIWSWMLVAVFQLRPLLLLKRSGAAVRQSVERGLKAVGAVMAGPEAEEPLEAWFRLGDGTTLVVEKGDITQYPGDAIVNAGKHLKFEMKRWQDASWRSLSISSTNMRMDLGLTPWCYPLWMLVSRNFVLWIEVQADVSHSNM